MKFGKKLLAAMHPDWADAYVSYKSLKQTLKALATPGSAAQAEGDFVGQLMACIQQVNLFYTSHENDCAQRLRRLSAVLADPKEWLKDAAAYTDKLALEGGEVTLASLMPTLSVSDAHAAALREFIELCSEVDLLRKYSVLNYLAVVKIVKKHDKCSPLALRDSFAAFVTQQPFYTSTQLAATFTHAQCIAAELIAAATGSLTAPQSADYSCSICMDVLHMPVILSCAHRFCHGCLAKACLYDQHCPLCKKVTDLDPTSYEVDPVLTKFIAAHFSKGSKPGSSAGSSPRAGVESGLQCSPCREDEEVVAAAAVAEAPRRSSPRKPRPTARAAEAAEMAAEMAAAELAELRGDDDDDDEDEDEDEDEDAIAMPPAAHPVASTPPPSPDVADGQPPDAPQRPVAIVPAGPLGLLNVQQIEAEASAQAAMAAAVGGGAGAGAAGAGAAGAGEAGKALVKGEGLDGKQGLGGPKPGATAESQARAAHTEAVRAGAAWAEAALMAGGPLPGAVAAGCGGLPGLGQGALPSTLSASGGFQQGVYGGGGGFLNPVAAAGLPPAYALSNADAGGADRKRPHPSSSADGLDDAAGCGGGDGGASKKRGACTECYKAKAACVYDPKDPNGICARCTRLGRECVPHERQRRRRRNSADTAGRGAKAAAKAAAAAAARAAPLTPLAKPLSPLAAPPAAAPVYGYLPASPLAAQLGPHSPLAPSLGAAMPSMAHVQLQQQVAAHMQAQAAAQAQLRAQAQAQQLQQLQAQAQQQQQQARASQQAQKAAALTSAQPAPRPPITPDGSPAPAPAPALPKSAPASPPGPVRTAARGQASPAGAGSSDFVDDLFISFTSSEMSNLIGELGRA